MSDTQVGIKDIIATVRKDPALMIVVGVLFVGLLYYLYTRVQAGNAAGAAVSTSASSQPTGYAPATGSYTYVEGVGTVPGPVGPPGPPGPPGPSPTPTPPGPKPPVPAPKPPVQKYPFPGKSPFAYQFGHPVFPWTDPNGKLWTIGFGPSGHVWGVAGTVSGPVWENTPVPPKTLLFQD